jgi:hypothetical protein
LRLGHRQQVVEVVVGKDALVSVDDRADKYGPFKARIESFQGEPRS